MFRRCAAGLQRLQKHIPGNTCIRRTSRFGGDILISPARQCRVGIRLDRVPSGTAHETYSTPANLPEADPSTAQGLCFANHPTPLGMTKYKGIRIGTPEGASWYETPMCFCGRAALQSRVWT